MGVEELWKLKPSLLYKKVYTDADRKEVKFFSVLCGYDKLEELNYNKVFKVRYIIQKYIKANMFFSKNNFGLVYFLWDLGPVNDLKKLHLAKAITVFNKRNRLAYNVKYYMLPNFDSFTISHVLLPKGKSFIFVKDRPCYESLDKNLFGIIKHYEGLDHYIVLFTDKVGFECLKFLKKIENKIKFLIVLLKDSGVYFVYPSLDYKKMKW
jgi:hypothetical protein